MKYLYNFILALALIIIPFSANATTSDCDADPDMLQLIKDLVEHDNLAEAIKKNVNLTEVWYDLERSDEADLNNDENVLDLLINIPRIKKNGGFAPWFDKLSLEQASTLMKNKVLRERIENRLRWPGGYHEWCMVCRVMKFKEWGVSVNEIHDFRTKTKDLKWTAPMDSGAEHPGKQGQHGGNGSGAFHNELKQIIDTSDSYSEFKQRLKELGSKWNIDSLPIP